MKLSTKWLYVLLAVGVVLTSAWLTRFTDEGMGAGWAYDVLRNWEQYGFFHLHGQLVYNMGGFEVETHPEIYHNHRAVSLYPAFLCFHFLGGAAGIFVYYTLMAAMVFWSIWQILGRTEAAFWLGGLAVLTPGFVRWQTSMDPNLVAALFGFPFGAAVLMLLRQPVWRWPQVLALSALVLVYSMINWTTAFVHGMVVAFMVVAPKLFWRRLFIYVGLGVVCAGAVVALSLVTRLDPSKDGGAASLLTNYGWGNAGYGLDMATSTAVLRVAFTNLVGLLPVWLFLAWRCRWPGLSFRLLAGFLPLLSAAGSFVVLRNYAGHHPWMTCHFILLGLILSAAALKLRLPGRRGVPAWAGIASVTLTFGYASVMLALGHKHDDRQLALIHFIRDQTPRSGILLAQEHETEVCYLFSRLETDRHSVVVPAALPIPVGDTNQFMVTTIKPPASSQRVAHLDLRETSRSWMDRCLDWYAKSIAHRRPGDKVEVQATDIYIYQP